MTMPDPVLARLPEGIDLRRHGRKAEARAVFEQLWADIGGADGLPLHRCTIAHCLADAQDDVTEELRWDLAALDAVDAITDEHTTTAGMGDSAAAFLPSLHLNVAECYRKLGDLDLARHHLELGQQSTGALPDGDYATTIRSGLHELAQHLDR